MRNVSRYSCKLALVETTRLQFACLGLSSGMNSQEAVEFFVPLGLLARPAGICTVNCSCDGESVPLPDTPLPPSNSQVPGLAVG